MTARTPASDTATRNVNMGALPGPRCSASHRASTGFRIGRHAWAGGEHPEARRDVKGLVELVRRSGAMWRRRRFGARRGGGGRCLVVGDFGHDREETPGLAGSRS